MLELGRADLVWPLLAHGEDPDPPHRVRPHPGLVRDRPGSAGHSSAIGEGPGHSPGPDPLPGPIRPAGDPCGIARGAEIPLARLVRLGSRRRHPRRGRLGVARRWGEGDALDALDAKLRGPTIPADRGWYVGPSGATFAVVRGPVTFPMGTAPDRIRTPAATSRCTRRRSGGRSRSRPGRSP